MSYKLGSLFDGSGGFPLAGSLCGIEPVWAAEVEPYPIAVTRSRFPGMRHLGDISKINGAEIEPVDVITFGSPCQDLSVAGKRAGLKHEANGDDETTRSGLFMEAVRIFKEMREATNGIYPRIALWENVPGAFSSNKGEDFRIVLEELIKIVEPYAIMPEVPKAGWAYADSYRGDGWSLAYRVFDAQYWGVPHRRRRIHLVVDFRGTSARKVLFEREGLRGYFEEGRSPWQGVATHAQDGVRTDGREGNCLTPYIPVVFNGENITSPTNAANPRPGDPCHTLGTDKRNYLVQPVKCFANVVARLRTPSEYINITPTITARCGTGGNNTPAVCEPIYCLQGSMIGRSDKNGPQGSGIKENACFTLNTIDRPGVSYCERETRYIVRLLTPTECARLQGFPELWGDIGTKEELTPEEYKFWMDVRNTHAAINGKTVKEYTKEQMLKWYNKLHTDSSEYKMWGNGIALPPALYCMQGIADALKAGVEDGK